VEPDAESVPQPVAGLKLQDTPLLLLSLPTAAVIVTGVALPATTVPLEDAPLWVTVTATGLLPPQPALIRTRMKRVDRSRKLTRERKELIVNDRPLVCGHIPGVAGLGIPFG